MGDGELEVPRHPHRQLVVAARRPVVLAQPLPQRPHPLEAGADPGRVGRPHRDGHQAADPQRVVRPQFGRQGSGLVRGDTGLLRLPRRVHLEQHIQAPPLRLQPAVELAGQPDRVEGLELDREPSDVLRLVRLQVPDDRPFDAGPVQAALPLGDGLLDPVLPQSPVAGVVRHADGLQAVGLGDRQQSYLPGVTARVAAGRVDPAADLRQVGTYVCHGRHPTQGQRAARDTTPRLASRANATATPTYRLDTSTGTDSLPTDEPMSR
ncbi:hypothetical protein SDC9_128176 [bioreactor metagenome]|uniref:Uncharacterized protein n=1 Tax=bioreactor metagenome TaxID=1076179 RepID=A0A645CW26_9ZZZZ